MTGWKCDNIGDIEGEKPANCSVIGSLGKLTKFQEAVTYISFASTILTFVGSLSSGPGPFLLINAVALMRTFSVFNPKMDEELKKQLNNQLKEIKELFDKIDIFEAATNKVYKEDIEIWIDESLKTNLE